MAYSLDDLAWLFTRLAAWKVNAIIIGSTIVDLELNKKSFEDDVDVFAISPSPLLDEDKYSEIAFREGWQFSYTALGTPKLIVRTPSDNEIILEVYENIHDFFIPQEMLQRASSRRIRGATLRMLQLEDYIVLKAKAARETDVEELRIIKEYIDEGRLKIDSRLIKQGIEFLPEEDKAIAVSKLREVGFRV